MPSPGQNLYHSDLHLLLHQALDKSDTHPLEQYLTEHSALPGPRMNTALVNVFAGLIGELVIQPEMPPIERLEALLDGWAALSLEDAPVNNPREILPAAAVMSYGRVAVVRPDWWDDEVAKLHKAASNRRWRVRELVAAALQRMLVADWERTYQLLVSWLSDDDPLVIRASAAAIAEPPLLVNKTRGENALFIQTKAINWLEKVPLERRREEGVAVLCKALGYTLSVASPKNGLTLNIFSIVRRVELWV